MTLQRKFALLLGTLSLVVVTSLGTALWSVWMLERELSGPLASIGPVLAELHSIKKGVDRQARALQNAGLIRGVRFTDDEPEPIDPGRTAEILAETNKAIRAHLASLEGLDTFRVRAGLSTTRNMHERLGDLTGTVDAWIADRNPASLAGYSEGRLEVRALIERIEGLQVQDFTPAFLAFGGQLRTRVTFILGVSVVLMALAATLAVILIRRWVTRPVARLRDATARIAAGDFAHRINVEGRDELALLSYEVNHMAGTISSMQEERVERERLAAVGEMVRRIAHNLRNPLAGIRSLAELTRSDLAAGSTARAHQDRIVNTVDRFEGWLKEILSATTPLKVSMSPTRIAEWLERVVEPLRPMAAARGIELAEHTQDSPAAASIDPRHLEQAVVAIIINAIQATPNGSRVSITTRQTRQDGNTWELRVSDQGAGVPQGLQDKIFRPYFTTKRDGTGIGLALARQVVEQHGGRIWVEPGSPQAANGQGGSTGAVFVIRLPLQQPAETPEAGHSSPARGEAFGHHSGH